MASYIPATLSLDPAEAARIHAERLSLALAAKATRDAALAARKGSSSSVKTLPSRSFKTTRQTMVALYWAFKPVPTGF